jgi:hypothetical protein
VIPQLILLYSDGIVAGSLRSAWSQFVEDAAVKATQGYFVHTFAPVSATAARTAVHSLGVVYYHKDLLGGGVR